jgi:hypothetical protein
MKNTWLGYLSSVLMLMAGVLMILGEKPLLGAVFIIIAIAGVVLRMYMGKKKPEN